MEKRPKEKCIQGGEPNNQEVVLKQMMQELEKEPLVFNPNVFQDEGEIVFFGGEICIVQPTTLEESVEKILQENPEIDTEEVYEQFAPPVRKRVKELVKEFRPKMVNV